MSLKKARTKIYEFVDQPDDSKELAKDRLQQRLMKIREEFKQSAPHASAANMLHINPLFKDELAEFLPSTPVTEEYDDSYNLEDESVEQIDEADAAFGVPPENDNFHQWLVDKFGPDNIPTSHEFVGQEACYSDDESWPEWPECNDWPTAMDDELCIEEPKPEPNPMDIKGNKIAKKLAGLQAELRKIEENKNVLVVEEENLTTQLDACKKRILELDQDHVTATKAIETAKEEQTQHMTEMDELQSNNERKIRENKMISEVKNFMDDFSQAVQILLNSGKYCDFEHLIRAHMKEEVYLSDEVKNSVILEAKHLKRDQLYATLEAEDCYLSPKNMDGLPNLFDQYITDSYNIINE